MNNRAKDLTRRICELEDHLRDLETRLARLVQPTTSRYAVSDTTELNDISYYCSYCAKYQPSRVPHECLQWPPSSTPGVFCPSCGSLAHGPGYPCLQSAPWTTVRVQEGPANL